MKCTFCNRDAVYYRENEGNYYCKLHFIRSFEKKVKGFISKYSLVSSGDILACALSGGKDSSTTLFLMKKIFEKNPKVKIFSISIDEGIKSYRDKSLKKAEKLCMNLGIRHYIFSFKEEFGTTIDKIAKSGEKQICSYCGVLRRYLLNKKARELGATKLVVGHNLDDEVQTMVMNLIKGDILRLVRIGPIPRIIHHEKFVQRIKPLAEIPEKESAIYSMLNNIEFHLAECPYAYSDEMRKEVTEFLNKLEETSPGSKYTLIKSGYNLARYLRMGIRKKSINVCEKCGELSSQKICKACEMLQRFVM
jgi:uncharacterized protein (TIGR00269 family)